MADEPILKVTRQEYVEGKKTNIRWIVTFASRNLMGEEDVRLVYIDAATEKAWTWVGGRTVCLPEVTVWTNKRKRPKV